MAKVTYSSLKLKNNTITKSFEFEGNTIEVLQYLPIEDKIDLIDITLQKAIENDIYNPIKVNMFFHLLLVYFYTNISFTDKQREDEYKLYNTLETAGLIDLLLENIPEKEYDELFSFIQEKIVVETEWKQSAAASIRNILDQLPISAQAAADIINGINVGEVQNVLDFAKAVNNDK